MRISDWSSDVCSSDLCFEFLLQLLLAGAQLFSECAHVGLRGARLSKHAAGRLFFLAHMMFDLFAEHRHFGVVEFSAGLAIHQLRNQHLATVMFDMRFVEDVVLNLAPKCWIENLLLRQTVV